MHQYVPKAVDFMQQAENNRCYQGSLPISELERLHDVLNSTDGEVEVSLTFGWRYGIPSLTGSVAADVELICQRCLQPMRTTINGEFCFALLTDESEIDNLPDDMEPYIVEDEKQSIIDVITDEILISIPLVAKHEEDCVDYIRSQEEVSDSAVHRPFASIKDLLD